MPNDINPYRHEDYHPSFAGQIAYARERILSATKPTQKRYITARSLFNKYGFVMGFATYRRALAIYLDEQHPDLMITDRPHFHIVYRESPNPVPMASIGLMASIGSISGMPRNDSG